MRIGIDIMGGDYAPLATVKGTFLALEEVDSDIELVLFGNSESIIRIAGENNFDIKRKNIEIVHCTETIDMDEQPYKAFTKKIDSGIVKGFRWLKNNEIDAFCSAGSTGAVMIGAVQMVNAIPGIIRPAVAAFLPNMEGTQSVLLDVGLNPDSRPDVLYQYGILGSAYATAINKISNPRVALINIGSEEEKGNLITKSAYQLMKDSSDFSFYGNVEGMDLFYNSVAEVLVCDGFVGNVILKEAEGFYRLIKKRNINDEFFETFNFENFGGTPVLGINKPVIVGHGISGERAIKNMILQAVSVTGSNLIESIKTVLG
jgi:phosphate acyltransferase